MMKVVGGKKFEEAKCKKMGRANKFAIPDTNKHYD